MELGMQVDPLASAGSLFVLGGFALLQLKIRFAMGRRELRDAAAETYRKAEVLQLAGKIGAEEVRRAAAAAQEASAQYEEARRVVALGGALLRLPDPNAAAIGRLARPPQEQSQRPVNREEDGMQRQQQPQPGPAPPAAPGTDPLEGVRGALRLEDRAPATSQSPGSLLPTGSRTVTAKDLAIGFVFVLQVGWFFLSLTDPVGAPNPILEAALSSGGEAVDRLEARRAAESAEYAAMMRAAAEGVRDGAPPG
jgi:hypothetical protein